LLGPAHSGASRAPASTPPGSPYAGARGTRNAAAVLEDSVSHRIAALLALSATVALGACNDDDNPTAPSQTATVQFLNASSQNLDFLLNGTPVNNGMNVGFGAGASCMTNVNVNSPGLTLRNSGSTTLISGFTPTFAANGRYTVLVTGTPGNLQFTTLTNIFQSLGASQAGLRIANASGLGGGFDFFVTAPGATLPTTANATNITTGNASNFFTVASGTQQLRLTANGSQTVILTPDNLNLTAGKNYIGVVAAPLAGQTTPRFFIREACM
jgi:hypothetical protein